MKVLFTVTHLLGTGHLSRVLTLARAFTAADHEATVLSGGLPAPHLNAGGVTFVQLPPVRSDGVNFSTLLDADGIAASEDHMSARRKIGAQTLQSRAPDVLITELFPFGRKSLAAEFEALLSAAHNLAHKPLILSSVRDILAPPRKPKKIALADDMITRFYDGVLVHSDEAITPLSVSWPMTPALEGKLHYTGFVAPPLPAPPSEAQPKGEVIVSAGGGSVGAHLYDAALQAAAQSDLRWRILVGGAEGADLARTLSAKASANTVVEPARPDFRQLLQTAACSVSLCGYNTALDVLQARCPAVFVPFDEGTEVEQGLRARSLASRPEIDVLNNADLTPAALLGKIATVTAAPRPKILDLNTDGAAHSVTIVQSLLKERVHV